MHAHRNLRQKSRRGTVIVEFALIVPFFFLIVFAVIDFSRAYAQLNAMNAALREGARLASVQKELSPAPTSLVRKKVRQIGSVLGYNSIDTTRVTVTTDGPPIDYVTVTVTAHPVPLPVLGKFLGISPLTITRSVRYRWERTGTGS